MDIKDLLGAGHIVEKLLATVEKTTGAIYRPIGIRLEASAEAKKTRLLGDAQTAVEVHKQTALARVEADRKLILDAADAELATRVARRDEARRLQQQRNLDAIVADALLLASNADSEQRTANEPPQQAAPGDVDPDWMMRFIDLAEGVSGREMQLIWGRVLAREIQTPGNFSVRSLEVLKGLTRYEAEAFGALCRLLAAGDRQPASSVVTGFTEELQANLSSFGALRSPQRDEVDLSRYGLPFVSQLNLQQSGLLHNERLIRNVDRPVDLHIAGSVIHLNASGKRKVALTLLQLTPTGVELTRLVDALPYPEFAVALADVLRKRLDVTVV